MALISDGQFFRRKITQQGRRPAGFNAFDANIRLGNGSFMAKPHREFDTAQAKKLAQEREKLLEKAQYHESVQEADRAKGFLDQAGEIERTLSDNNFDLSGKALAPKRRKP